MTNSKVVGFVLKSAARAEHDANSSKQEAGQESFTVCSDGTVMFEDPAAGKVVSHFSEFHTDEPSLITLFKSTILGNLDRLIEHGDNGGLLVCGGNPPHHNTHVHNVVYAMAIFALDTLLSSTAKLQQLRPPTPSVVDVELQQLEGTQNSASRSDTPVTFSVSWYAAVRSDSDSTHFDQVDILAARKFSSIAPPELGSSASTERPRSLMRITVGSASDLQQLIENVQQDPQVTALLQSTLAHHSIVLQLAREETVLGEFSFMWLGANLTSSLVADGSGGQLLGTPVETPSPFPHLRALVQQSQQCPNSAVVLALSGQRVHSESDTGMLRFGNQYVKHAARRKLPSISPSIVLRRLRLCMQISLRLFELFAPCDATTSRC